MQTDIVVIGSLNSDLVMAVEHFPGPGQTVVSYNLARFCGGKGANQAYAAAKLGATVAMIGHVGNDAAGRDQREGLASLGINVDFISVDEETATGTALIMVDQTKENRIIVFPGANFTYGIGDFKNAETQIAQAKFVLLQLEIPMEIVRRAVRLAKGAGACLILDPAPFQIIGDVVLKDIDYLTPNLSELAALCGFPLNAESTLEEIELAARRMLERGANVVIAKLGPRGALKVNRNGSEYWPGFMVQAMDPTAAGDCFNAAFAVALRDGLTESKAGAFANAAAALSVTRAGAQASMPHLKEVKDFIRSTASPGSQSAGFA